MVSFHSVIVALILAPLALLNAQDPKTANPTVTAPAAAATALQVTPKARLKAKPSAKRSSGSTVMGRVPVHHLTGKEVELNGASKAALMKLPGITEAYANKIIAGRPYLTKAALVGPNRLTPGMYQTLKDLVVVSVPTQGRGK